MNTRDAQLLAIKDRAWHTATGAGDHAPDWRWIKQYLGDAALRYKIKLTPTEYAILTKELTARR